MQRLWLIILFCSWARFACAEDFDQRTLTKVQQIRDLSPLDAQGHLPVHLRGIVTYSDEKAYHAIFMQDETGGIHVPLGEGMEVEAGQLIELKGTTHPGEFAPTVVATNLKVLGIGRLPEPRHVTYADLATGKEDSQWVELTGIVRSIMPAKLGRTQMDLLTGGQKLRVLVGRFDLAGADQLINATVRVQGVCYSRFNQRRQLRAPWLGVTSGANISVVNPAPANVPEVPISALLQFNSDGAYGNRVKIRGTVTHQQKGRFLFIQGGGRGLYVRSEQATQVVPGDFVEVIGFPALGQFTPILEDAIFKKLKTLEPIAPVPINAQQAITGDHEAALVTIEARLVNRVRRLDEQVLFLQSENLIFQAQLEDRTDKLDALKQGSLLALTGVCVIQPVENWNPTERTRPESFRLLLRTAGDVLVVKNPPWWTLARLFWAIGILSLILFIGVAWVVALNQRVRQQTGIIQQKFQREAVLEERNRIAREFHDTLEQELAAIIIQLDIIAARLGESPQVARQHLELVRTMSRRSLAEARRSVWDLRSHLLENSNLPTALSEMAKPLAASAGPKIQVRTFGTPRKFPTRVENNLLRIAQEALANAVKHAQAKSIEIELHYDSYKVRVLIRDDGLGFKPNDLLSLSGGHFGLLDMRERAEKAGGSFHLQSNPGLGTQITVEVRDKSSQGESVGEEERVSNQASG